MERRRNNYRDNYGYNNRGYNDRNNYYDNRGYYDNYYYDDYNNQYYDNRYYGKERYNGRKRRNDYQKEEKAQPVEIPSEPQKNTEEEKKIKEEETKKQEEEMTAEADKKKEEPQETKENQENKSENPKNSEADTVQDKKDDSQTPKDDEKKQDTEEQTPKPTEVSQEVKNLRSKYKADLAKEVSNFLKSIEVRVDIERFKEYCQDDPDNIKLVEKENPIEPSTMFVDISMVPKGVDEEKVYLSYPEYTTLIRRGNTLLEIYEYNRRKDDYDYKCTHMLRKGMKKFVDLPFDFIKYDEKLQQNILNISPYDPVEKTTSLKYIFYPAIKAVNEGYLIEIIKLMKANGENAQLSYNNDVHAWVIASKNVSLCARKREDLDKHYPLKNRDGSATRWKFAYLIGQCWFDIISSFKEEEIKALKEFMHDKTLIGEYVGNQYHQHLIRYIKHTILFFGIVENQNQIDNSLPVVEAFKLLKKFKLDVVPYEYIGAFETIEEVYDQMKNLYIRIAESSIIDEEEGSVIYLSRTCARNLNSDEKYRKSDKVLSLSKLKTWEYRIYRKLREKIKNHLADENYYSDSRRKISQFFDETRSMLQGFNLPMPIEFYYKVAETAFDFANYYHDKITDLHSSYIDFIETIHSIVDESVTLKSRAIQLDNIMTYDYLIKNQLKAKKTIEIVIYAPPCYLSEEFLKKLASKYNTQIYNSFIASEDYIDIDNEVIIYHINMHNFRNITKMNPNNYIIAFGLNEKEIKKSMDIFKERSQNPLFKTYNANKSLTPFIEYRGKIEDIFKYYAENSVKFITKAKKNFPHQVSVYNSFDESNSEVYFKDIDLIVNAIKKDIANINIDSVMKDSFYVDNQTLIGGELSKGKKKITQNSKYKNSPYISLYEEHVNPYEKLKAGFLKHQQEVYKEEKNKPETSSSDTKQIIVLIPMTIPGNGKTFFINQLKPIIEKYNISFHTIGSDLIRREIMDDMMRRNRRLTEEEAFQRSAKPSGFRFEERLRDTFASIYQDTKIKKALIYIDKNHPTNAINRSTEPIRKYLSTNFDSRIKMDLKFVALLPECINSFEFTKNRAKATIPFSLSYFIQCYLRVKHRNDHPTLNGDAKNLINIFGIFIANFIDLQLTESSIIMHQKLDKAIKLPFTDEVDESQLPEDLVDAARNFFSTLSNNSRGGNQDMNIRTPAAERFEYLINKHFPENKEFFPTKGLVSQTAEPIVAKLFNEEITKKSKVSNFIYLGVMIKGEDNFVPFKAKIYKSLSALAKNFKMPNEKEVEDLVKTIQIVKKYDLPEGWKYPHKAHKNLWHCTTMYKGNQSIKNFENTEEYLEFEQNDEKIIRVLGMIYIPEKIIVTPVALDGIKSVNEFPHLTTFTKKYVPKKANDVMKSIFSKDGPNKELIELYKDALKNSISTKKDSFYEVEISIVEDERSKKKVLNKAYVAFYGEPLELKGIMNAFER